MAIEIPQLYIGVGLYLLVQVGGLYVLYCGIQDKIRYDYSFLIWIGLFILGFSNLVTAGATGLIKVIP